MNPTEVDDLNTLFLNPLRETNFLSKPTSKIPLGRLTALRDAIMSQDIDEVKDVLYPHLDSNLGQTPEQEEEGQQQLDELIESGITAFVNKSSERQERERNRYEKRNLMITKLTRGNDKGLPALPIEAAAKISAFAKTSRGGKRKTRRHRIKKRKTQRRR